MKQLPKISIITPSYQQADYLEQTIVSVLEQGYPSLEYIVIDGGSTDGSVDIIKKYEAHLTYWVSEPDKGQTDAINKGLKKATGDVVAWINSDDIYCDGALHAIGKAFADSDADLIYGDVENFFPDGRTEVSVNNFEVLDFLSRVSIHQPGVFWKRSLHQQHGYLDESFYYLMDYDLWARLFFNCKHQHINKVITRFRVHDAAKTGNNPPGLYMDHRRVLSRFFNSLDNKVYKLKAQQLGLYENPNDVAYMLAHPPTEVELEKAFVTYVMNCIVQEYTFGHVALTNRLILKSLGMGPLGKKIIVALKNNIGLGKRLASKAEKRS